MKPLCFVNLSKFAPFKPYTSRVVAHKPDKSVNTKSKSCDQAQQDEAPIRFCTLKCVALISTRLTYRHLGTFSFVSQD